VAAEEGGGVEGQPLLKMHGKLLLQLKLFSPDHGGWKNTSCNFTTYTTTAVAVHDIVAAAAAIATAYT
jgi:hypothetical protein